MEEEYEQAIAEFERAIAIDPTQKDAYAELADLYIELEEYEDAKKNIFINQTDSLLKINVKNGKESTTQVFDKGSDIIVYNENNILICCQTKAKYLKV